MRVATTRADLALAPGETLLGGGTWLFSEPQPHLRRLIDLHGFGWEPLEVSDEGLRIAATCRIADLYAFSGRPDWPASLAHRLEPQPDLAARLWRCDRAIFYSAFHLDVVRR